MLLARKRTGRPYLNNIIINNSYYNIILLIINLLGTRFLQENKIIIKNIFIYFVSKNK